MVDTNILVASLSKISQHHWIIDALLEEHFEICISNDILLEYEEVLLQKYGPVTTANFLKALQELPNVLQVDVWYNRNLLSDEDDNKFVDAAIAGGASYIVSEDRHFRQLDEVDFPKVRLFRLEEFKYWYDQR